MSAFYNRNNGVTVQVAKTLAQGDGFTGTYVLRKCATRTSRNGSPFLSVELGDRTGSFNSTVFSDSMSFETFSNSKEGGVFKVEASVDTYQGRFAPRIGAVSPLDPKALTEDEIDALVEKSPEDADKMWAELQECVAAIEHDGIRALVESVFEDIGEKFRTSVAAVSMHHAYRGGLLEHTLHMAKDARVLLPLYPEIDPSLALAGIILHDCGKVLEYEQGLAPGWTRLGNLQGHLVIGYRIVRKHGIKVKLAQPLLERLEHILLSHHGKPEFGAAVLPATPEAIFVSLVDNFDAKMGAIQKLLRNASGLDEFTDRMKVFEDAKILLAPPETGRALPDNCYGGAGGVAGGAGKNGGGKGAAGGSGFNAFADGSFNSLGDLLDNAGVLSAPKAPPSLPA